MHSRPMNSNQHNGTTTASMSSSSSPTSSGGGSQSPTSNSTAPVAFVEFKDAECAGSAMATLQGTYLLSSDRGPIRIEYAKSKMAIIGGDSHQPGTYREVLRAFQLPPVTILRTRKLTYEIHALRLGEDQD